MGTPRNSGSLQVRGKQCQRPKGAALESQVLVVIIKGTQSLKDWCVEMRKRTGGHLGETPTMLVIPPFSDFWGTLALAQLAPRSKMSFPWFRSTESLENFPIQIGLMGSFGVTPASDEVLAYLFSAPGTLGN